MESTTVACDSRPEDHDVPTATLKRAASEAKLARKTIEELPNLSFTTQSRFFRLFEWLEECMDYAGESIGYEEYEAAQTDLCRSRRGIGDAVSLLTSHTGVKAPRALFRWKSRRPSLKIVKSQVREQAEPKHEAQVIHLLPTQESACPPPTRPRLILM